MSRPIRCVLEVEEPAGVSSVEARTSAEFSGLGPPDLCRLTKMEQRLTGSETHHSYHSVIGLDTLNSHSVVAYLYGLMESLEPFNPLNGSRWKVVSGMYCIYDAFSGSDIRVEVKVPGMPGVSVHTVSLSDGTVGTEVPEEVWEGAMLSAYLRTFERLETSCLNVLPNISSPEFSPVLTRLAGKFIERSDVTGLADASRTGANVFAEALANTYLKRCKLREGMELFASLQSLYPPIVAFIAKGYRLRGQGDAALSVLMRSLRLYPENEHMLMQAAEILQDEPPNGTDLALTSLELAVRVAPGNPWVWIGLAEVYRRRKEGRRSVLALNNALSEFLAADQQIVLSDGLEARTASVWNGQGDLPQLVLGPGSGLASWLDEGSARKSVSEGKNIFSSVSEGKNIPPNPLLNKTEKASYKVLVRLREDLGWDALVALRATLFGATPDSESTTEPDNSLDGGKSATDGSDGEIDFGGFSSTCCGSLDRLFTLLHDDLSVLFAIRQEMIDKGNKPWLPTHTSGLWIWRAQVCRRFRKWDYLEVCARMAQTPSVETLRDLLSVYIRTGKTREAILVLCHIWGSLESKIFPQTDDDHPPPWLLPSLRAPQYASFHFTPPWLMRLVVKTARRFGVARLRNALTDKRLLVLDQLLAQVEGYLA